MNMNYSDLDNVVKCREAIERIDNAMTEIKAFIDKQINRGRDPGGIDNLIDYGYFCSIFTHFDMSGASINLDGCYVALEIAESTLPVLNEKKEKIEAYLISLGVNTKE